VPIVFFDRVHPAIETANVVTNDFDSAYSAASLLLRKGCKRLTFLALRGDLNIIKDRTEGYLKAIKDHGSDLHLNPVLTCGHQDDETMSLIRERLTQIDPPDGFICSSEKLTTQTYSVCHSLKIAIPEKMRIIGFSHLPIANLLRPSLTTVTQPAFEMGRTAATLLLNALDKKRTKLTKESVVLPSKLMERESSQ
jgi:LacI family transcriptional regulator